MGCLNHQMGGLLITIITKHDIDEISQWMAGSVLHLRHYAPQLQPCES